MFFKFHNEFTQFTFRPGSRGSFSRKKYVIRCDTSGIDGYFIAGALLQLMLATMASIFRRSVTGTTRKLAHHLVCVVFRVPHHIKPRDAATRAPYGPRGVDHILFWLQGSEIDNVCGNK